MTNRLKVLGRLTAAEDRTLTGTLLPYGEAGYTSAGRVVAGPGSAAVPEDLSALHCSLDHLDDRDSVAEFVSITEDPAVGLVASWTVKRTHGGDKLLAEYAAGKRTGVSVELEPFAIKDGRLTAGQVVGCAFPERPAFPTARLVAEDHTPAPLTADYATDSETTSTETYTDDQGRTYTVTTTRRLVESSTTTEDDPQDDPDDGDPADDDNPPREDNSTMTASAARKTTAAPVDLFTAAYAAANGSQPDELRDLIKTPRDLFRLLASYHDDPAAGRRLLAALQDVTATDHAASREQPQWVQELWSGVPYTRRIVPLVNQAPLTAMKVSGWRWVTKPTMSPYAGDKAPVPSNKPVTEPVSIDAERLAGAHDIDRKYRDFGDEAFFASYYAAMSESYSRLSDSALAADLKASATVVAPGAVPADVNPGMAALVDGALAIVDEALPTFAMVAKDVWRSMLLTPKDKVLELLTMSLDLQDGQLAGFRLVPAPAGVLDAGEVLVGARSATTFHELGGGAPIRVSAIDMVNGGEDHGCFGYYATNVHDAKALALVDTLPADETAA